MNYEEFLIRKTHLGSDGGFEPVFMPDLLFDFQKYIVEKTVRRGRHAAFADCGLGKTAIILTSAQNIVQKTNKRVLVLTPLAVAQQFVLEGNKFGIECEQSKDGKFNSKIVVSNYERLHYFNPNDFIGVACDESSILKNFDGKTRKSVTDFMLKTPYRMLGTATPSPNDFIELGTSSEALGEMGYMDMLGRFFKNDQNTNHPNRIWGNSKWRFRGHSERDFWRWVCSWAIAIKKPSDIGFDDGNFILPPITTNQHVVESESKPEGFLFPVPAFTLAEQRDERRRTLKERCEKAAELVNNHKGPSIAWCFLNDEADLLENLIKDCVQIKGSDSIDKKEELIESFMAGQIQNMVSKPEITGFGLNCQHCAHQTYFPSHSFEQYYQAVRRSWRFGQKNPVTIDIVTSEGQTKIMSSIQRKTAAAEQMFSNLVSLMNDEMKITKKPTSIEKIEIPKFI